MQVWWYGFYFEKVIFTLFIFLAFQCWWLIPLILVGLLRGQSHEPPEKPKKKDKKSKAKEKKEKSKDKEKAKERDKEKKKKK